MSRPSRRQHEENQDRWLISYSDFITLLFALFVVLYAISKVDEEKYKQFGSSLNFAFGTLVAGKAGTQTAGQGKHDEEQGLLLKAIVERRNAKLAEQQRKINEAMQQMSNNLNQVLSPLVKNEQVSVNQTPRGVVVDINASALFEPGEANLQRNSLKTLNAVAKVLQEGDDAIEVEGHTDDIPIFTPQFPSNWELSSARASSVVRLFIEQGVDAERLRAVGLASYHPIASNDTPDGRARNRRVTITVLAPVIERPLQTTEEETGEISAK